MAGKNAYKQAGRELRPVVKQAIESLNNSPIFQEVKKTVNKLISKNKIASRLEELRDKGFEQVGEIEGYPVLKKSGTEVVLDKESLKLIPKSSFSNILGNRKFVKSSQEHNKAVQLAEKKMLQNQQKIADEIFDDAKKRGLGMIDFSLENWMHYTPGYKMPKEDQAIYLKETLPQIYKTYKELVNNDLLRKGSDSVEGFLNGKYVPLKRTEDVLAYIMSQTPNGQKLWFNGVVASSGKNASVWPHFLRTGTLTNFYEGKDLNKATWADTDFGGAFAYMNEKGPGGGLVYETVVKPSVTKKEYIKRGWKTDGATAHDESIILKTPNPNPSSNHYNNGPIGSSRPAAPFRVIETETPLIDDYATQILNRYDNPVKGKFRIYGEDLIKKAILGNNGRYSIEGKDIFNPMRMFVPGVLLMSDNQ